MDITTELIKLNVSSIIIDPTVYDEELNERYKDTFDVGFSHKMAATRAGLGWVGKTDLLVTYKFGPGLRFSTILIDHPIECGTPINESRCGKCNLCVQKCPAEAANGKLWDITVHRDEFYNPFKCSQKGRELSNKSYAKKESVCGICISVCPFGKKKRVKNTGCVLME